MERVNAEIDNPRFGHPGEFPRVQVEAAKLSDLIAMLADILATEGDRTLIVRHSDYEFGTEESAVWRRTDGGVKREEDARFNWECLMYNTGKAQAGQVKDVPEGAPVIVLETNA